MLEVGTIWTDGVSVGMLLGWQPIGGTLEYNIAGQGWLKAPEGTPIGHDGTPWTQCDATGTPLAPQTPPITD